MKKTFLVITVIALLTCSATSNAQTFKPSGKTLSDLCSEKITISAEGDFNKDGIKDLFLCTEDNGSAFYFGKADGGYKLFRNYDLRFRNNAKVTVNNNGVLRVQNDIDKGSDIFLFRFQNDGFVLIGGKKDRHKTEHYDESYNFSTRKLIRTNGEGASKTTENKTIPLQPTIKYGWIPLEWDMLDFLFSIDENDNAYSTEEMTISGIYRRMQDEEMFHWMLCDIESYYGRAIPHENEDGSYSTFGIYESPGSYNQDTDVTFTKLVDGKYKIVVNEISQDRSYESQLNEDFSNLDDLDIPEEEKNTTIYIFDDGKFIEQK